MEPENLDRYRFYASLEYYDKLKDYWNTETHNLDIERVENTLSLLSHGEAVMLKFFAAVWLGKNKFGFDLFEAVAVLDGNSLSIIRKWIETPYYP